MSFEEMKEGPLGFMFDFLEWLLSKEVLFSFLSSLLAVLIAIFLLFIAYYMCLILAKPFTGMKISEMKKWLREVLKESVVNSPIIEGFKAALFALFDTAGEILSSIAELLKLFFGSLSAVIVWPTRLLNNWVGGVSEKIDQSSHDLRMDKLNKQQTRAFERAKKNQEFKEQKALLKNMKKGVPLLSHETKKKEVKKSSLEVDIDTASDTH
ncbi:hypothetical protein KFE96_00670 [Kordiimonas sp. SCSIO 12603]|uniref:hypothetical protein n=1 Tax=Kordiimonas sp. SCSIO 12603 TaxID=2829596 RepID=UPI002105E160|nr:hypothetical protein [Kordiimonas sp. SCSIO 12603]UTW58856.1 hypothetical protein KFE96_00670 [Kordiimonas sp. SCSIO 12603]